MSLWNLGLRAEELKYLAQRHPETALIDFDFDVEPAHFDMRMEAGSYAWKPVIIDTELRSTSGVLIWMDAGDRLVAPLTRIQWLAEKFDFFSPLSTGTIEDWTFPTVLDQLDTGLNLRRRRNLNGALVALNGASNRAQELARTWAEWARDRNLICPTGSSRANHRQDQSLLGCIAYDLRYQVPGCFLKVSPRALGVAIHMDDVISEEVKHDLEWMT